MAIYFPPTVEEEQVLLDELPTGGEVRIGFQADHLSWHAGEALRRRVEEAGHRAVPATGVTADLRAVKDEVEVAALTAACRITTDALAWLFTEVVAVGRTERELATALERRFVDLGAEAAGFTSSTPPVTSQSKHWRMAARCCLTVGFEPWSCSI